jgi:uncharacterized protein
MSEDPRLLAIVNRQPYPLIFATISGAHLYGFPSPDSDYDLRGVHVLPLPRALSLFPKDETIQIAGIENGLEMDLVTHDAKKFFGLMLKKNGYVLEQLFSPLIVQTTPWHDELRELGKSCVTRHHAHHYLGFAETQWKLFSKEQPPRVKPLLYVYRVLLTGIHLMRSGVIEANLLRLTKMYPLDYIPDLLRRKLEGPEKSTLNDADLKFHQREYARLRQRLEDEYAASSLPENASAGAALDDLLVRVRLDAGK